MDRTQGRKLDSATANKTNEYNRTRDIRQSGDPLNDPGLSEDGIAGAHALGEQVAAVMIDLCVTSRFPRAQNDGIIPVGGH